MIPPQKDKKNKSIYIYILFFILISSINNKNIVDEKLFSNKLIFTIAGLPYVDNQKLIRDLIHTNKDNIFKIDEKKLLEKITKNNLVLNFFAKKKYPNEIEIKINKATYIGKVYRNKKLSLIGSNGKLINLDDNTELVLPYFYGNFKKKSC